MLSNLVWNGPVGRAACSLSVPIPTLDVVQELGFKATPSTILTVGGRYSRFDGGAEVAGMSAGVSQYFAGGMLSYRLTGSRLNGKGRSFGHLASFKLDDPGRGHGSTQLWLSAGSSLHDEIFLPGIDNGRYRSVAIKRSQPLGKGLSLDLGFDRNWYDKPLRN